MRTRRGVGLGLVALMAIGVGAPHVALGQSVVDKIKRTAKQKVTYQKERTVQGIVDAAVEPLDSALLRASAHADSVVSHAARAVVATLEGEPREVRRLAAALRRGRAVLNGVTFLDASEQLDSASNGRLAALAEALAMVEGRFVISAYVKPLGEGKDVERLAARRSAVVRTWLVAAGIPEERLFTSGGGAARPQARIDVRRVQ